MWMYTVVQIWPIQIVRDSDIFLAKVLGPNKFPLARLII